MLSFDTIKINLNLHIRCVPAMSEMPITMSGYTAIELQLCNHIYEYLN